MKSKPKSLVICCHLPPRDPRVIWHIRSLKKNYEVEVLYTRSHDEKLELSRHIEGVKYHACPEIAQTYSLSRTTRYSKLGLRRKLYTRVVNCLRPYFYLYPRIFTWLILALSALKLHTSFIALRKSARHLKGVFDLIVANDLESVQAGIYVKRRHGGILIYDSHENWACVRPGTPRLYEFAISWYERKAARSIDLITTVSPLLVEHLSRTLGHSDVMLLPNATPVYGSGQQTAQADCIEAEKRFAAEMDALARGRLVVTFQGGVSPERGLKEIVNAWQYVPENEAILVIRTLDGPNPELEAVINIAKINGTFGRSIFRLPSVKEEDLISAAKSADVGIIPYNPTFPNHVMACPNKLSQYMQAGLAIFSNNIPYVRKIIEDAQCGAIYTSLDTPEELAAKIMMFRKEKRKLDEFKINAKMYAQEKFNWDVFYVQVEERIRHMVDEMEHSQGHNN